MLPLLLALTIAAPTQLPTVTSVPATSSARLVMVEIVDGDGRVDGGTGLSGADFAKRLSDRVRTDFQHHPQITLVTPPAPITTSWPCDDACRAALATTNEARLVWLAHSTRREGAYVVEVDLYDAVQQRSVGPSTVEAATIVELIGPLRLATDGLIHDALSPTSFPRVLFPAGVATTAVGVVAASVGVAGALVNIERAEAAKSSTARADYESWRNGFAVVGVVGGVAVVGGAAMMMIDLLRERHDAEISP